MHSSKCGGIAQSCFFPLIPGKITSVIFPLWLPLREPNCSTFVLIITFFSWFTNRIEYHSAQNIALHWGVHCFKISCKLGFPPVASPCLYFQKWNLAWSFKARFIPITFCFVVGDRGNHDTRNSQKNGYYWESWHCPCTQGIPDRSALGEITPDWNLTSLSHHRQNRAVPHQHKQQSDVFTTRLL